MYQVVISAIKKNKIRYGLEEQGRERGLVYTR